MLKLKLQFCPFVTLTRFFAFFALLFCGVGVASAHPLGNFTINRYVRLTVGDARIEVRYVIDMAEIPTLQELQAVTGGAPSQQWLAEYAERLAPKCIENLHLTVNGEKTMLRVIRHNAFLQAGAGGLSTLRLEFDFDASIPASLTTQRLRIEDDNDPQRIGWREIVAISRDGVSLFDSSAFANDATNELRSYPEERLTAPLDERAAEMSLIRGSPPAGHKPLRLRNGEPATLATTDSFASLINVPSLTPLVALLGLFAAFALGGLHSLSPGHGKTVVGAYLIGSRGTPRHAAFLGLTVTITHTAGVFALGLITLFASQYILPERLFPILSLISSVIVVALGMNLLAARWRAARGAHTNQNHSHEHGDHSHTHAHGPGDHVHSHDGHTHSHLPPGDDGAPVTWRSLLALGISGGLLPCPSALVVLLSAISLHRVGYGLLLIIAFSLGLASVLTGIGLLFVFTGKLIGERIASEPRTNAGRQIKDVGRLAIRYAPVVGALAITLVGIFMCGQILVKRNAPSAPTLSALTTQATSTDESSPNSQTSQARASNTSNENASNASNADEPSLAGLGFLGLLGLGLVFGLKHATEADHIVAVSAIVSEHRNVLRAGLVGGLWGIGHTSAIFVVGIITLSLRLAIPESVAQWLEFGVSFMIIALGVKGILSTLANRTEAHGHTHTHDNHTHSHFHFHESEDAHDQRAPGPHHSHSLRRLGFKPFLVGAAHGLAGSAALTLLVLSQIPSVWLGLAYLAIFGVGSIGGMLAMSGLIGIPFALTSGGSLGLHRGLRLAAGVFSVAFGLWYAYGQRDALIHLFAVVFISY